MALNQSQIAEEAPGTDRRRVLPTEEIAPAAYLGAGQATLIGQATGLAAPPRPGRGFDGSRAAMLLGMQQTLGNQAVQRYLQRRSTSAVPAPPYNLDERIRTAGGGHPLDAAVQAQLERGLGADLSGVRVHADPGADSLARAVDATAFTTGQDVFFRQGAYNPGSPDGLRLLAHEATHTVQQATGPVAGTAMSGGIAVSDPSDAFEQAAERAARLITSENAPATAGSTTAPLGGDGDRARPPHGGSLSATPATAQLMVQRCEACGEEDEDEDDAEPQRTRAQGTPGAAIQRWPFSDDEDEENTAEGSSGGGVLDWLGEQASGAVNAVSEAGSSAVGWAEEQASAAVEAVSEAGNAVVEAVSAAGGSAVEAVSEAGSSAAGWVKEEASAAVDAISAAGSALFEQQRASVLGQISGARQRLAGLGSLPISDSQVATLNEHLASLRARSQGLVNVPGISANADTGGKTVGAATIESLLASLQSAVSTLAPSSSAADAGAAAAGAAQPSVQPLRIQRFAPGPAMAPVMEEAAAAMAAAAAAAEETAELGAVPATAAAPETGGLSFVVLGIVVVIVAVVVGIIVYASTRPTPPPGPVPTPTPGPAPEPTPEPAPEPTPEPAPEPGTGTSPGVPPVAGYLGNWVPPVIPPLVPRGTRQSQNQTCDDAVLAWLEAEMHARCDAIPGESCSPKSVSKKKLARRPCSEIRTRIAALELCWNWRTFIQDHCFGGQPDARHMVPFNDLANALNACRALEAVNCAPGHPMAGL
jgi:hypothetical protein